VSAVGRSVNTLGMTLGNGDGGGGGGGRSCNGSGGSGSGGGGGEGGAKISQLTASVNHLQR
jgi:hypothetical protein